MDPKFPVQEKISGTVWQHLLYAKWDWLAGEEMKTYVFKVMIEPDGDGWRAYFPAWEHVGASTWGFTQKEALKNIQEVLQLVLEDLVEENDPIPEVPEGEGFISAVPQVAVTI